MSAELDTFLGELDRFLSEAQAAFTSATDPDKLEQARIEYLGAKSGRMKAVQKGLGTVAKDEKPLAGKRFNEVKQAIDDAFETAKGRATRVDRSEVAGPRFDPTLPGVRQRLGRTHPLTQTIAELKEIMGRLGFSVTDGPEIEDEWHNFEALNIPPSHPARDPLENFYLATAGIGAGLGEANRLEGGQGRMLLRSQTSTVQIRVMEKQPPPVRIVALGRVYRPDDADDTHFPMFHQIEGLLVEKGITMAHLKTTLRMFASNFLGRDVNIRFRPSFFPFTEPSVEVDMSWNDRWIEMGGAGMVDPHVLRAVGYNPDEVTGFAFGLGVERVCARRHNVTDIREFYKNDVRFLRQF